MLWKFALFFSQLRELFIWSFLREQIYDGDFFISVKINIHPWQEYQVHPLILCLSD